MPAVGQEIFGVNREMPAVGEEIFNVSRETFADGREMETAGPAQPTDFRKMHTGTCKLSTTQPLFRAYWSDDSVQLPEKKLHFFHLTSHPAEMPLIAGMW